MAALRQRLGEFEPAPPMSPPLAVRTRALDPSAPLLATYREERRRHLQERAGRVEKASQHRERWRELTERHRNERAKLFRGSWKGKGELLNALRSVVAARQAQEKADLRDRQKLERAALRRDKRRFPSYDQWLGPQHPEAADIWRHRERRPATIQGTTFDPPAPRDIRDFSAVQDGGKVHYHLTGTRGAPAFTDRGRSIDVHDGHSREAVLAALQLSAQKWGSISIRGNEKFKRTCVELGAEHGFKISNPDLQQAIAAEREQFRAARRRDSPARVAERRPELMTPAAIYRRHLTAITREQPGRQADPSRLDAEVAARLAITGHSREGIARTIKEGARADRPNEQRDWDLYGRRAAAFAFSPPGREMRDGLRAQEHALIRLEGRDGEIELLRRLGGPLKYL
jgi:hypothetical protein